MEQKVEVGEGFVQLIDVMGSDEEIIEAARTSYGAGTTHVRSPRALIRYMMKHKHTSPFEFGVMKFLIECPMDVWRQWIRHRTASVSEYSTRYSEAIDRTATVQPGHWRTQATSNKQGSDGFVPPEAQTELSDSQSVLHSLSNTIYQRRLVLGVAREQARMDLPLGTYTRAYWKMDLHNLFHFMKLRMDPHAQLEIRQYANAIASIVAEQFPISYEAWEDYALNATTLSQPDMDILTKAVSIDKKKLLQAMMEQGTLSKREEKGLLEFTDRLNSG